MEEQIKLLQEQIDKRRNEYKETMDKYKADLNKALEDVKKLNDEISKIKDKQVSLTMEITQYKTLLDQHAEDEKKEKADQDKSRAFLMGGKK